MTESLSQLKQSRAVLGVMSVMLPPAAVAIKTGAINTPKFYTTLLLTLCLWVPGVVYSAIVCFRDDTSTDLANELESQKAPSTAALTRPKPRHPLPRFVISFPSSPAMVVIANLPPESSSPIPNPGMTFNNANHTAVAV